MDHIKRIHHVAIVVENIDEALCFWEDALGLKVQEKRDIPEQQVSIAFLPLGGSELELVKPTSEDSGVAKYLESRGPGMHHLCLEVDDLDEIMERLQQKGVQLINDEPLMSPDGTRFAFVHPKSAQGVLVELYEVPPSK